MALSDPVLLCADPDTTNATSYVSPSVSPAADSLVIIAVQNTDGSDAIIPSSVSVGFNITGSVTLVRSYQHSSNTRRISVYRCQATGSPGSGTITADFGADAQTGCTIIAVYQTGHNTTTPVPQSSDDEIAGAGGTSINFSLDSALVAASSKVIAIVGHNANEDQTAGDGFTELASSDVGYVNPAFSVGCYYATNDIAGSVSWATTSVALAVVIEVAEAAGGAPQEINLIAAAETDTAQALTLSKRVTIVPIAESDAAQALSFVKTIFKSITPVSETEIAQVLDFAKHLAITAAAESGEALPLAPVKKVTIVSVSETGEAQALSFSQGGTQNITIIPATETDVAQALSFTKTIFKTITPAAETNVAIALSYVGGEEVVVVVRPPIIIGRF